MIWNQTFISYFKPGVGKLWLFRLSVPRHFPLVVILFLTLRKKIVKFMLNGQDNRTITFFW